MPDIGTRRDVFNNYDHAFQVEYPKKFYGP